MKMPNSTSLTTACLALLVGCGDESLTDRTYQGAERFALSGTVQGPKAPSKTGKNRVAVQWVNFARNGDTVSSQSAIVSSSGFPAEFSLKFFSEPPTAALNDLSRLSRSEPGAHFVGTGLIVAFEDADDDGKLTADFQGNPIPGRDRLWGIDGGHVLIYAKGLDAAFRKALESDKSLFIRNPAALQPGFNLARAVCATEGLYDKLEIVPNEPLKITPVDTEQGKLGCLNFF